MTKMRNQVQLTGRLGANPEVKLLEDGKRMARFSIAVTETRRIKTGEKITDVQWHSVVVWGPVALFAEQLLHKGTEVTVEGKLLKRSYTTREGQKREIVEVHAHHLHVPMLNAA